LMGLSALLFLASLNLVLRRLGDMLPDEALRQETRQFTSLNLNLLGVTVVLGTAYYFLSRWPAPPPSLQILLAALDERGGFWLLVALIPLVLLPLAMTMALLWKIKEVILENVFGAKQ
jgi:hypothetical protein